MELNMTINDRYWKYMNVKLLHRDFTENIQWVTEKNAELKRWK